MSEIVYKSLIPKFNSQEEISNCQSVKITTSSNINDLYKFFDKNEKTYINTGYYRINIVFEFKNKVNLKKIFFKATERSSYNSNDYANFYVSNNGEDWNNICNFPKEESEKIIKNDECYKYYKMNISYAYGGNVYEIDLFTINNTKFLIKQNNDYYALKSNLLRLGQPKDRIQKKEWYEKHGTNDINIIFKELNKKSVGMTKDEATGIYKTVAPVDFNEIIDNIELVEDEKENKSVEYGVKPYRIYDLLENEYSLMIDKASN